MLQNNSLNLLFLIKARGMLGLFLNVQIFFALFPDLTWIFTLLLKLKLAFKGLCLRKRLSQTLNGYQYLTLINVHAPTWLVLFLGVFISFKREQISANKYSNTYWNLHHGSSVLHWWQNEHTLTHHHSTWAPWILLKNTWIIKLMGVEQKWIVTAISTFVPCFNLF